MEARKVLVVTYYWPPCGGAGVQRWLKFSKYMPAFGITPYVVTVDPTKATYPTRDESLCSDVHPDLKVITTNTLEPFGLYKSLTGKKQVPQGGFANQGKESKLQQFSKWIRGNLFIPDARVGWNFYAAKACETAINKEEIDTIITTGTPHSTHLVGLKMKKELGTWWLADFRDPWTDIYYYPELKHTAWAAKKDANLERKVLEEADCITVVSEAMKVLMASKSDKINPDKIFVIANGFDERDFDGINPLPQSEEFVIAYVGTLAPAYPIDELIESLVQLIKQGLKLRFDFTGSIPTEKMEEIKQKLGDKVLFRGHQKHEKALQIMLSSHLLYLAIPDVSNNEGILTGKLFEYLASGAAIACVGPVAGNAAEILKECKAGKCVNYGAVDDLKNVIVSYYKRWAQGIAIRDASDEYLKYSRKNLTKELVRLIP